jgi:hypothetical protein
VFADVCWSPLDYSECFVWVWFCLFEVYEIVKDTGVDAEISVYDPYINTCL